MSEEEKYHLFLDAIKDAFLKYDFNQAVGTLDDLIRRGKYDYFTNGPGEIKYRDALISNVSREDAYRYCRIILSNNLEYQSYEVNAVSLVCMIIIHKTLLKDFCKACYVTYSNYDELQLKMAIKKVLDDEDYRGFSRFSREDVDHKRNYRDILEKYGNSGIINLMGFFLDINKIKYDKVNMNHLINTFVDNFIRLDYLNDDDKTRNK